MAKKQTKETHAGRTPKSRQSRQIRPAPNPHKIRLTDESVIAAMVANSGNLSAVSRAFGKSRGAAWAFIHDHPEIMEAYRDIEETWNDNAESALRRAILAGEPWAIKFQLERKAKDRGYSPRIEHTGEDGDAVRLVLTEEIVDADTNAQQSATENGPDL